MNTRRLTDILAAAVLTAATLTGCNTTSEVDVDKARIAPEKVREMMEKAPSKYLLVDARPQAAFDEGHLPGAVRMDPKDLDPQDPDPKFAAYKTVIVYGESPAFGRANALTKRFLEAGVSVMMIDGGMKVWRERGFPVEP